ncbi:MAG: hypothetical protein SH857_12470 [Chitinophagales bacterium]|nr:hypothetical protein [Chitinophagales bacterium]
MRIFSTRKVNRHIKYLLILVSLLFTKDLALMISSTDNPLYWMENVEENDQKADAKEKVEKKEINENKFTVEIHQLISAHVTLSSLHIISERKYCAPSFDVVVPPPKQV